MAKKIYKIGTTAGERFAIGSFEGDELLAGATPHYYKTLKAAEKHLKENLP